MAIHLDTAGLTSAASQLSGTAQTHAPAAAEPPGADVTSVSAVSQLNAASTALATLLSHGSAVREVGALSVSNTATFLTAQDELNAAGITNGSDPGMATGLTPLPDIPSPNVPVVPAVPAALAPLPGEAHAHALYGGPGSSSLHEFADHWEQTAAELRRAANTTTQAGGAIDASWNDGRQRAGANTRRHGEWLSEMGNHAEMLARQARSVASSFETAKHSTPNPQEFAQARQELQAALERFSSSRGANAAEVQEKSQDLAYKQTQATSAATTYHSAVSSGSLASSVESMKLAPPIADGSGGDSSDVQAAKWKPGDKMHYPIIRGPNGMGPAQPGYGPGWVELGPGSGNFVREDELPGLKIQQPGQLGPAAVYDSNGNRIPYVELGPGSGAWAPASDFPHAQLKPPGALGPWGYEEYLPGTGIWIPRTEIVPDPADPTPPSGATLPA
ncbi:PPE domain-containing protein [Mycobacterium intracellulare]|jgi:hypothetical protein|uniref:PPE domain-containing protein n=1 Tax=Mycobacterium intracellulare TaxID=1767 RepID=UPI000BAC1E08|nr:PPE domain-containing protein [Mycobacterium intracellulare]ASX03567.1 hypothetical protein CKJ58_26480 [Mycobacterium intracellulare subsp. chimaera]PBA61350.1 hypothetical protein CKJ56_13450 [Mycobacterium intracellulare subsp. chimaera]